MATASNEMMRLEVDCGSVIEVHRAWPRHARKTVLRTKCVGANAYDRQGLAKFGFSYGCGREAGSRNLGLQFLPEPVSGTEKNGLLRCTKCNLHSNNSHTFAPHAIATCKCEIWCSVVNLA